MTEALLHGGLCSAPTVNRTLTLAESYPRREDRLGVPGPLPNGGNGLSECSARGAMGALFIHQLLACRDQLLLQPSRSGLNARKRSGLPKQFLAQLAL